MAPILLGVAPSPSVPSYAIMLNVLLFSSLILSLASTIIGILVKQWLCEYNTGLTGSSREAAQLRQYRLNNLVKWHVNHIIRLIPILLLVSLGLFLAGVLVLTWALHPFLALVTSILTAVVAVSTAIVTVLPLCTSDCAYLSSQTQALFSLWRHGIYPTLRVVFLPVNFPIFIIFIILQKTVVHSFFPHFDSLKRFTLWLTGQFPGNPRGSKTWREYEQSSVNRLSNTLDIDMLVKWYDTTLSTKAISSAAICLLDQGPDAVLNYFTLLDQTVVRQVSVGVSSVNPKDDMLVWQVLLCALNMGSIGLLRKPLRSLLYHVHNYLLHPAGSEYSSSVKKLAAKIAVAAASIEDIPISPAYPVKEIQEVLERRIIKLQCREREENEVGSSRGE